MAIESGDTAGGDPLASSARVDESLFSPCPGFCNTNAGATARPGN